MEAETFYPKTKADWRKWLAKNHNSQQAVWLLQYKKNSGHPSLSWSDAVDEALCYGWIDSVRRTIDEHSYIQFFTRRKPNSTWSKINKEKIERLTADGKMTEVGLACIAIAKQNGSWTMLDEVEELIIPADLVQAFQDAPGAEEFFLSLSKSVRKAMLQWLVLAKREATRTKRVQEIVLLMVSKQRPKQF